MIVCQHLEISGEVLSRLKLSKLKMQTAQREQGHRKQSTTCLSRYKSLGVHPIVSTLYGTFKCDYEEGVENNNTHAGVFWLKLL